MSNIELRPVKELLGMNFFIPEYQRGYRWKTRQVQDLLDDIQVFIDKKVDGKYCLQPLVVNRHPVDEPQVLSEVKFAIDSQKSFHHVKSLLQEQWDVVDGQQRLTTIYILLSFLRTNIPLFRISYATRNDSANLLCNLNKQKLHNQSLDNLDYKHIYNSYCVIEDWFKNNPTVNKENYYQIILNQTEFIWYESEEKDPIEVFTRLNIGKISLTNAELVKALLLNKSNFMDDDLTPNEVALVWDQIECTLQNDRFWCFLHEEGYEHPTRIDYILDLIEFKNNKKRKKKKVPSFWEVDDSKLGNDHYRTFRYFDQLLRKNNKIDSFYNVWKEIVRVYNVLKEWYNDNKCYHYVGYLTLVSENESSSIPVLLNKWENSTSKEDFVNHLKNEISRVVYEVKDLDKQYEKRENGKTTSKTKCLPILLLFNVQTIVDKNERVSNKHPIASLGIERFSFDLYRKEKGWDIEHIASNTDSSINNKEEAFVWLKSSLNAISDQTLLSKVSKKISELEKITEEERKKQGPEDDLFELCRNIEGSDLDDYQKNKIGNFCLLDQTTNRSYGNSIFALKRKRILEEEANEKSNVFILPCTLRVFTKFYSMDATELNKWTEKDSDNYKRVMADSLSAFGVTCNTSQP